MQESGNGLDLRELAAGDIPAITAALGAALAEAGGVRLESQGHNPGVTLDRPGTPRGPLCPDLGAGQRASPEPGL